LRRKTEVTTPRLLVFSSLFPSAVQPNAGLFIRERMFRVGKHLPIVVVAPQPWFPGQQVIRWFRPHFRPMAPKREVMDGIVVHRPRSLCIPGVLKWTDGLFMALSSLLVVRRIARDHHINIIDAHFGYPTGYAAVLLGRWLKLPVMLTLRGKEERQARTAVAGALKRAITSADQLIAVSSALRDVAIAQGVNPARVRVIGNGVDLTRFTQVPRSDARRQIGLPDDAEVLVSAGTLVERKGFHRVIECLPGLMALHPRLHLVIIGGAGPEGDMAAKLKTLVRTLGLDARVHFLGPLPNDRLKVPLSAADVFVLATSYEGWANVFLEAMACGLPVVTTDVGGNAQVVNDRSLGRIVPFGDKQCLQEAIHEALCTSWDRQLIRAYAESNSWDRRMQPLIEAYQQLLSRAPGEHVQRQAEIGNAR
jgi:teichuronic acid biosynthesis glycosyltransferase TuaC